MVLRAGLPRTSCGINRRGCHVQMAEGAPNLLSTVVATVGSPALVARWKDIVVCLPVQYQVCIPGTAVCMHAAVGWILDPIPYAT